MWNCWTMFHRDCTTHSPAMYKWFNSSSSLLELGIINDFFILTFLVDVKYSLIVVLFYISLMVDDVGHLYYFIYLFPCLIPSLVKVFVSLFPFLNCVVCFLSVEFRQFFYILNTTTLMEMYFGTISQQFVVCLFYSSTVSFTGETF